MQRILVIDDDETILEYVNVLLSIAGYRVEKVSNGSAGLALVDRYAYSLIITDLIMPDKEGIEIIRSIRKRNKTIPIIAMSGSGKNFHGAYLDLARMLGATCTIVKPFKTECFLAAVRECFSKNEVRAY